MIIENLIFDLEIFLKSSLRFWWEGQTLYSHAFFDQMQSFKIANEISAHIAKVPAFSLESKKGIFSLLNSLLIWHSLSMCFSQRLALLHIFVMSQWGLKLVKLCWMSWSFFAHSKLDCYFIVCKNVLVKNCSVRWDLFKSYEVTMK